MIKEHCGVVGAYFLNHKDPSQVIYNALISLQHRGQESFGIASLLGNEILVSKELGLVNYKLIKENLREQTSKVIAHVRYSTTGNTTLEDAQPSYCENSNLKIALCFNGNIVNFMELRKKLKEKGYLFKGNGDGEVLAAFILECLKEGKDIERTIGRVYEEVEGAYSTTFLSNDGYLVAFRDPYGFRPLNIGFDNSGNILIASETVAFDANDFQEFSSIKPGEMVLINEGKPEIKTLKKVEKRYHCMFEFVYFSRPDSIFENKTIYEVRWNLGKELAKTYKTDADVIVPIPDSSRPAAEAISRETGIPVVEGLIKNRYIGRTFIMPKQEQREKNVKLKLNPVKSLIRGKKVLLIDDSLVRGTTIKRIVEIVRKAGAEKVYVWITCPPIISPCFYGIDIAIHGELIASSKTIEEIRKEIGADELCYQTIEGLKRAIGLGDNICLSCLTGTYPTPLAQKLSNELRNKEVKERYWEIELNV
jgi:amidophosphoribosyltransferase